MIRHVWWYGCLHRFTIGNPKYLEDLGCPCGPNPPPLGSNGWSKKILFTFVGIYVCTFTSSIPLGVYGLDFISITIWVGAIINGDSIIVTID
jgi:hypothetical protein